MAGLLTEGQTGEKMKVLIIEDNRTVRSLVRRALMDITVDIWECADGSDALAAYTYHRPDVVLMDIHMPGLDGLAATRRIRRFNPAAKVVMVTDYDGEDLKEAAHEAGACGYVLKQNLMALVPLLEKLAGEPGSNRLR